MAASFSVDLSARPRALDRLLDRFTLFAQRHHVPAAARREVHLAIDEIVSNIIRHGAAADETPRLAVTVAVDEGALRVEVTDTGKPFNPLAAQPPRTAGRLSDRPIGGLGIHLVKNLMDRIEYRRTNGRNRLRFERALQR